MRRWTPKLACVRSRRQIETAIRHLRKVSAEWEDVDQMIVDQADDYVSQLESFANDIDRDIRERLEAGEHVGL